MYKNSCCRSFLLHTDAFIVYSSWMLASIVNQDWRRRKKSEEQIDSKINEAHMCLYSPTYCTFYTKKNTFSLVSGNISLHILYAPKKQIKNTWMKSDRCASYAITTNNRQNKNNKRSYHVCVLFADQVRFLFKKKTTTRFRKGFTSKWILILKTEENRSHFFFFWRKSTLNFTHFNFIFIYQLSHFFNTHHTIHFWNWHTITSRLLYRWAKHH